MKANFYFETASLYYKNMKFNWHFQMSFVNLKFYMTQQYINPQYRLDRSS